MYPLYPRGERTSYFFLLFAFSLITHHSSLIITAFATRISFLSFPFFTIYPIPDTRYCFSLTGRPEDYSFPHLQPTSFSLSLITHYLLLYSQPTSSIFHLNSHLAPCTLKLVFLSCNLYFVFFFTIYPILDTRYCFLPLTFLPHIYYNQLKFTS